MGKEIIPETRKPEGGEKRNSDPIQALPVEGALL
jgi:hypothetical protein